MIDKNISPETRAAWIETCQKIRENEYKDCTGARCVNCPVSSGIDYFNGISCMSIIGEFNKEQDHPAIRAYFERILKELKNMDEPKMTKEEARYNLSETEKHRKDALNNLEYFNRQAKRLQAIIDAPEPDPRVGKLFVCDGKVFLFGKIHYDSIIAKDGRCFLISDSHAVTRAEMENMLYKKCCSNCGYNNKCGNTENILMVCSAWEPKQGI